MLQSDVVLGQGGDLGVTDDAAHMRGYRKQAEIRAPWAWLWTAQKQWLYDVPMLALPKKRPLLVEDDGGGGF